MRRLIARVLQVTFAAVAVSWTLAAQAPAPAQVTAQDLRDGLKNPTRWLNYGGDYGNQRHSPLTQITPANVHRLTAQWQFQTDTLGKFEATPLVLDGVVYVTGPLDTGWAIDARTGRQIWRYKRDLPSGLIACCGLVNRGFGVLGDRLFKTTLDAHMVAISRKTGAIEWDTTMVNYRHGYSGTTAPLVVKDKVIAGVAGAEYGIRGFIEAYDAQTGKQVWRFYTTAGPADPGHGTWRGTDPKAWEYGGGSIWVPGAYDPELNLTYWGTGNAGPDYNGSAREGDNLYTASIVALDADTGALKWHYQFTPHDIWDYDSTQMPVLADLTLDGQLRKVVLFANRNGFFYVLDRATGKMLRATPFIQTTWAKSIRPDGRPMLEPNSVPSEEGTKVCPDQTGGTNWMPPAFSPSLNLLFVTARESCGVFFSWKEDYAPGDAYRGGAVQRLVDEQYSMLRAIDVLTGEKRWEFPYTNQSWAGVLSTASGLVFAGGSGNVIAFDAKSGKNLWRFQTGSSLYSGAITYMVDDRQYVLMPSGTTLTSFALAAF